MTMTDRLHARLRLYRWILVFWSLTVGINGAAVVNETLHGDWTAFLNLGAIGLIAGAYIGALRPMLLETRRRLRKQEVSGRRARIAELEKELGIR